MDRLDWLALVTEDVIDPAQPIVDPHHHLWAWGIEGVADYGLADLRLDTGAGHNVVKTVFVECGAGYRTDGPEHLRPVGETEFVARLADESDATPGARIASIVGTTDLRADAAVIDEVLDAHSSASGGRFRGIRHAGACDPDPASLAIAGRAPAGLYLDPAFQAGVRHLGERGLTYDTWHYHHQNADFLTLAEAAPGTTIVLDHLGTPLGVGRFAGQREEIFEQWRVDIAAIARYENVVAKLGGLAMPDNGFGWHLAERPATSDDMVGAQARYYEHMIECFGVERCMFESNFPVDKMSASYVVVWNAFKKMTAGCNAAERQALFHDTAALTYRI